MRYRQLLKSATRSCIFPLLVTLWVFPASPAWCQVSSSNSASTTFKPFTPLAVKSGAATVLSRYDRNRMLRLTLGLQPPNVAEERQFLQALETKGKPGFHQFLSAEEWTKRFDPSVEAEQAVVNWATAQGLTVTRRFPNRLIVDVEGTVATIEKAFGVTINSYQLASKTYFSNDRDPQLPANLINILHSVGGLNSFEVMRPNSKNVREPAFIDYAPGQAVSPGGSVSHDGDRSKLAQAMKPAQNVAPSPNYTSSSPYDPQDMYSVAAYSAKALYNLGHCCNPLSNAGGSPPETSIAIASFGDQQFSDMDGFHATYPYLADNVNKIYIDGTPPVCSTTNPLNCDGEGTMDMEWSTAMSNSFGSYLDTAHVWMYDGVSYGFATAVDVYNAMLTDGHARNFSTSWGCEEEKVTIIVFPPSVNFQGCYDQADADTADAVFSSMVGQGWSLTAASGDQGASAGCDFFGTPRTAVQFPASDPNVVAAGGTTHYMNTEGTNTAPSFTGFTAWTGGPDGCDTNDGGSTGGYSIFFSTPSYQSSLGLPSRGVPDISLDADWYNTPQNIYFLGALSGNGGTSIVAPETAGFFAQENAYLLALGNICGSGGSSPCAPLGPVNPWLYDEGYSGAAPHVPFYFVSGCNNNDITTTYSLTYYCTPLSPGWSPVTGWGEYNFLQLAWAINWYWVPGYTYPSVSFSGPTTNKWYNTDKEVTWSVNAPSENSFPSDGTAGFSQSWDSDPGNPKSEVSPGIPASTCVGFPCIPYNAFYNGPQYPNATSGCLDFTGSFCAGSIGGLQGWHYVNVRAWGNEGENSGDYTYGPIGYDTIPPVTTDALGGTLAIGATYKSAVTVTLTASDPGHPSTGSGVSQTFYELNGEGWKVYTGPVSVKYTGAYALRFYSVDVAGNAEGVHSVSFSIEQDLTLSPSILSFGNEVLGKTSAPKSVTIKNISGGTVSGLSISNSGDFTISARSCGSSLANGATCGFSVTYTPSVVGAVTGDVTIAYTGAIGSPERVSLTGAGLVPLTASPASLSFGALTVGTKSAAKTVTLKNDNPSTTLNISYSASGDYSAVAGGLTPCGATLAGLASCTLNVTFSPKQNGSINGAVTISDGVSLSPVAVALSGSGSGGVTSPLAFAPTSLSFTNDVVGTSTSKIVTVKNTSAFSVVISGLKTSGDYSASGCATTLIPGASCTLTVKFTPSTTGSIQGAVALTTNASVNPEVLDVTGTAIFPLTISAANVSFGTWTVGTTSGPATVTLTNHLLSPVSIAFSATGDFSAVAGGGTPCGASLGAGASCTILVTFSPTTTGSISGVATVTHSGAFSPQEVTLVGTGQ